MVSLVSQAVGSDDAGWQQQESAADLQNSVLCARIQMTMRYCIRLMTDTRRDLLLYYPSMSSVFPKLRNPTLTFLGRIATSKAVVKGLFLMESQF